MSSTSSALLYEEPSIQDILILSSFLLLLNALNHVLNRLVFCGLLGQVVLGIAYGTPGGKWLTEAFEESIVKLGYLGLILIVYEGGLSTSITSLKQNLFLSLAIAITGIVLPIALSFVLQSLVDATSLQAFAAGAALCSTSLGTTFTVLEASGLTTTRLGATLSSAAMMDDVVGLVMVQVISSLGSSSTLDAATVLRPILVSVAFVVVIPLSCRYAVKPFGKRFVMPYLFQGGSGSFKSFLITKEAVVGFHSLILLAFVTGSSYAGTSNLFAAYLAGAAITWWDQEIETFQNLIEAETSHSSDEELDEPTDGDRLNSQETDATPATDVRSSIPGKREILTGAGIYDIFFKHAVERVLKPFFFASIGFSIPISRMFTGETIWRGAIYAILMTLGKLACGLWLVRVNLSMTPLRNQLSRFGQRSPAHFWFFKGKTTQPESRTDQNLSTNNKPPAPGVELRDRSTPTTTTVQDSAVVTSMSNIQQPLSLYPGSILGLAMIARGEIGFLVSSIAQSNGIFDDSGSGSETSELFLVITWAIFLCTMLGPIGVGLLVRRVRRLDGAISDGRTSNPLGIWGVK